MGRTLDSLTVPTYKLIYDEIVESDALAVVRPTGVNLLDFFCSSNHFVTVESLSLLYLLFIY